MLGLESRELLQDFGDGAAVLALQASDLLEARLERGEPVRIGLDRGRRVARRGGQIRDAAFQVLGLVAVHAFPGIDRGELRERPRRLAQPVRRRALVLGERGERGLPGAADPVGVQQAFALDGEIRVVGLRRRNRLDLANLEVQHLEARPALAARGLEGSQLLARFAPARGGRGRLALPVGLREGVEEIERGPGRHELLLGVLAVDRDQPLADPAERAHRRGLVVDEGATLPVGRKLASQQHRLAAASPARTSSERTEASTSNSPETVRRGAPWRMSSEEPRPPASRASASTRIDFPAPVSPVMTVSPPESSISRSSTIARFLTVRRRSTGRS